MFMLRNRISIGSARYFSVRSPCFNKNFSTPKEYVEKVQQENLEHQIYQENLINENFEYIPKFLGKEDVDPISKRPIPINVELLKYKPIQLPKTHGDHVATLKFDGYNENDLIRASEFAARSAFYLGIPTSKVINKKTEKRLYTVIKSPFAQAKSKENFKRTTFKKELEAFDANPEVIDLWLSFINKYAIEGVNYKVDITTRESLDFSKKLDELKAEDIKLPTAYKDSEDPIAMKVEELLKSDTFKKIIDEHK